MKKVIIILAALLVLPISVYSQYFQYLHDYDSTYDWGWGVHLKPDNTLFVIGTLIKNSGNWDIFNVTISSDGSNVLDKHILRYDNAALYLGLPGESKMLDNGTFITPLTIQTLRYTLAYSNFGLLKYTTSGDTLYYKTYTDTANYYDGGICLAVMPNNDILLGGGRAPYAPLFQGLLIRTDSLGDTIWTRTYPEISGEEAWFTNLIPISNNRIAASATSRSTYFCCGTGITSGSFYHYDAIFMILDSIGNVLKDTTFGRRYSDGGNLFPDRLGGYMQWGWIDTIADDTASHVDYLCNFPFYFAHLDTNFHIDWEIDLAVDTFNGRRGPWQIKQLQDGNFIVFGDQQTYYASGDVGWAMKVTRTGEVLWQHSYFSDSNNFAYIRDMVEKPDGSLVFIGKSFNDTLPAWHAMGDLWLIGTDSNGCELPGCGNGLFPASVVSPQLSVASLRVYPNPTTGHLTISAPEQGMFIVYDLLGQQTARYSVIKGETEIVLPGVAAGVYLGRFLGESGYEQVVRVVKE